MLGRKGCGLRVVVLAQELEYRLDRTRKGNWVVVQVGIEERLQEGTLGT